MLSRSTRGSNFVAIKKGTQVWKGELRDVSRLTLLSEIMHGIHSLAVAAIGTVRRFGAEALIIQTGGARRCLCRGRSS
jgi:hypothetical protein